jgi:archaemetzincin
MNNNFKRLVPYAVLISILFVVLVSYLKFTNNKQKVIGLQPYDSFNPKLIDTLAFVIESVNGLNVIILENKKIPSNAFININSPRYRADILLKDLKKNKPGNVDKILGLPLHDISFTKLGPNGKVMEPASKYQDWGIMGLATIGGAPFVISTKRLLNKSEVLFIERLKKVTVHEIGHTFGLKHFETEKCVMRDAAETVKTVDLVNLELCEI